MNIESPNHCFGSPNCEIHGPMKNTGLAMLTEKFDAFGEAMPDALRSQNEASTPVLGHIGSFGTDICRSGPNKCSGWLWWQS